ncbi:Alpha-L-Rha alpha-1,2-L-rhamnosyltransferase [Photobacterium marinum]|uniref:Alpha-L-Rha alpha-1,2-L-rhamnosyltransferase n=1 Tax=Photobacterium marinum TaxID=1056511 RepID=L8JA16_9GAMM|nr:rhamnan synthesis F family protein [Photobacterium marinum]ELR65068.1 Alpha-L-Rha alpha-1,2-L-rhamnosyltransferase [Photobacterium marinum]
MKNNYNHSDIKRAAFYLFYDKDGVVDDYIIYKLTELKKSVETIFFISNSELSTLGREKLKSVVDTIYCRENVGFDVWGYKEALSKFGKEKLLDYDEIILLNYTFFGPIFPFEEMFSWSESNDFDFWGISDHKEVNPNPFTGKGVLPRHIQSHFIAIRKELFSSLDFDEYWSSMPMIKSYNDSVLNHESRFTEYFSSRGYTYGVYCNSDDYDSQYPTFFNIDKTLEHKSPILKRRLFFHDPLCLDRFCVDLHKAVEIVKQQSNYDVNLIWNNISRTTQPRNLLTNAELIKVFPDESDKELQIKSKLAVIAHLSDLEEIETLNRYLNNIPTAFDLFITTFDNKNKELILDKISGLAANLEIRVVPYIQDSSMSSLVVACKDVVLDGGYDLICRIHTDSIETKDFNVNRQFKEHMLDNLLATKGYVTNIINFITMDPCVGVAAPIMLHSGDLNIGHTWKKDIEAIKHYAKALGIKVPFDEKTPYAANGAMFWFKPQALKRIFEYDWKWEDFESDDFEKDCTLSKAIEVLVHYCSHNDGYIAYAVSTERSIERAYVRLLYKYQLVMSELSDCDAYGQLNHLKLLKARTQDLESQINEIRDSTSWKLTLPVRKLKQVLQSIKSHF